MMQYYFSLENVRESSFCQLVPMYDSVHFDACVAT